MTGYPEKKTKELTDAEKARIRERLESGERDIYKIANDFGCSSSQVAGIKSAMTKGQ